MQSCGEYGGKVAVEGSNGMIEYQDENVVIRNDEKPSQNEDVSSNGEGKIE